VLHGVRWVSQYEGDASEEEKIMRTTKKKYCPGGHRGVEVKSV
jgi:hypothetical protein